MMGESKEGRRLAEAGRKQDEEGPFFSDNRENQDSLEKKRITILSY